MWKGEGDEKNIPLFIWIFLVVLALAIIKYVTKLLDF